MAALGLAFRRLSPRSVPVHWKSLEGAEASSMPDPDWKTSQRLVKMFPSSTVTSTSTLGRSSFGPRVVAGAGASFTTAGARCWWARLWLVSRAIASGSDTLAVAKMKSGMEHSMTTMAGTG